MMEGLITQRVPPLLKCIVLFMFIFTAKVLTSQPQGSQDFRNSIHHLKQPQYVRTFTKYHHRRTIQWNNLQDLNNYWPITQDLPKVVGKRSIDYNIDFVNDQDEKIINKQSVPDIENTDGLIEDWPGLQYLKMEKRSLDIPNSNEFVGTSHDLPILDQFTSDTIRDNIVGTVDKKPIENGKYGLPNKIQKYQVKQARIITEAPTTMGPTISCFYKIHDSVSMSVTPSYDDERNAQLVVKNDRFETGPISEMTLPTGDLAQVEKCTDTRASCYTLWHQDQDGNITVLGQGCWGASHTEGRSRCDKCTRVTARLPRSKFCCCTKEYCNADFLNQKEETVTAGSTMNTTSQHSDYFNLAAVVILTLIAILVMFLVMRKFSCNRAEDDKDEASDGIDVEKGEVMGSGPDALATGLSCVDNLTLIEHIGQGKFGSVWRGSLGAAPVAVKLYCHSAAWQREAAVYELPHLAHNNILRYYGSDTRPTLTEGGREHLIVLELCASTLRARLEQATITWLEFANLAHGLASALAHLHTPSGSKPCVVHRDVNSNNVLVTANGEARLADLGLAQMLHPQSDRSTPTRITEAGTLRYLSPEALEGALDLSGARAALCAVDVFALALVIWELLSRTAPAHPPHAAPPYRPPYHSHGLPPSPTLHQMQNLVSRNKARPPLPKGPVQQWRALKVATETCDECWDHDAEARLTAVCVEERMAELKQLLLAQGPLVHDNNLHPHQPDGNNPSPPEAEKNSNCTAPQNCDATTPLLYTHPHIGRNACIERNTHNTQQHTVELIHKSLKDISVPVEVTRVQNIENCLSVARVSHTRIPVLENSSLSEIRSYQRPLDYVPNDVTNHDGDRGPKETNLLHNTKVEKPKWGIRRFFERLNRNKMETEVKLADNSRTTTSVIDKPANSDRPNNLTVNQDRYFEGPCTLSPPNKTLSPTMMMESDKVFSFKEMPENDTRTSNQVFAVIVPKGLPSDCETRKHESSESLNKRSVVASNSSQSIAKTLSESEDSTIKKRLSCENRIINSGNSSRASINLELQYIENPENYAGNISPFDINSDCSSSEDEHLMLLSENGGAKITMQTVQKTEMDMMKHHTEVLKETSQPKPDFSFNKYHNKYTNFDNEFSDPNDKENLVSYSGDNPVYLAALNGEIDTADLKQSLPKSPKPSLKNLAIKRQHSLEHVSDIFSSEGDVNLLNPAGRVKTPGDLPVAVRRARRDRALQKGRASESNRLSLYDDRMMFGNSL